jgi:hypothetical protein
MGSPPRPKDTRRVKSKVKSMLIIFFDNKGIVRKELVLASKQSIPHTTVTFYGDWRENVRRLRSEL